MRKLIRLIKPTTITQFLKTLFWIPFQKAIRTSKFYLFRIRPFDILNINKFKKGKGDDSNIFKDLKKVKNVSKIQTAIKTKLEEMQEKLKKFEDMAKALGKDFHGAANK
jgi:hypothetical protein